MALLPKKLNENDVGIARLDQSVLLEALKSISQGVLITARDRRLIYANEAFAAMSGYAATEVVGRSCSFLQGARTDPLTVTAIRMALDGGQSFAGEILNYRKCGTPFWNDLTITPIRDRGGAVSNYIGITRDATMRKQAETALIATAQRYRLLFDHAQAGIVLHSGTTEVVYANSTASAMLDIAQDRMVGSLDSDQCWRFLREDASQLPREEYPVNRALSGRRVTSNSVIGVRRGKDPQLAWLMCNAYPVFDEHGEPTQVIVSFSDVTELKQTERAFRKSEERLRLVLRGANDAAWDFEMASDEYYYSPRWWQMLGYVENEFPTDEHLWRRLIHADDLERVIATIGASLANGGSDFELEFRLLHKLGHHVPVLSRGFISRDDTGKPMRISGTNTDLSERKRAEDALRQSEARLRAFVEASPFPAMLADDDGHLHYFNPACVATFGYQLDEVPTIGAWQARAYPNARYRRWIASTWRKRLARSVHSGRAFEPMEVLIRCKDGSDRTVIASAVAWPGMRWEHGCSSFWM